MSYKFSCILRFLLLLIFITFGTYILYTENAFIRSILPPCPVYHFTKIYCPGCGTGRSLHALLHGHLYQAFRFNILFILTLPFLLYALICRSVGFIKKIHFAPEERLHPAIFKAYTVIVILFFIIRNIPASPFSYLAPIIIR